MGVARQVGIEVHHLLQCVDAGVGAARARGGQRHAGKFFQRPFELVLHRMAAFLFLVAVPGSTVILQADCDPFQLPPVV